MDIGKSIQQSVDLYFKNFGTLFVAGLVAFLLSAITLGILAGPLMGGFLILCLKVKRGEKGEFNEVFAHFDKFVPTLIVSIIAFVACLVAGIIPILGIILGIVVNPAVSIIAAMALVMVIEKNMEPMDAIKKGIELFQKNPVMIWLFSLVMGLISGLGFIACIVGILATAPIASVGYALAYEDLSSGAATTGTGVTA